MGKFLIAFLFLSLFASNLAIPEPDKKAFALERFSQKLKEKGIVIQNENYQSGVDLLFDQILANIRKIFYDLGLITIPLPPIEFQPFQESLFSEELRDQIFNLTNGELSGHHTLHRVGDTLLELEPNGDLLLASTIGINDLYLKYTVDLNPIQIPLDGVITGRIEWVDVFFQIRLSYDLQIIVEELQIKNIESVVLTILDGIGPIIDFIINTVVNLVIPLIKDVVANLLSTILKDLLNWLIGSLLPTPDPTSIQYDATRYNGLRLDQTLNFISNYPKKAILLQ